MVYGAAGLALLRLSPALPGAQRMWARVTAVGGVVFSCALIAASEPDLLIWSVGSAILAMFAYFVLRSRRVRLAARAA
jgi:hypothetical protein